MRMNAKKSRAVIALAALSEKEARTLLLRIHNIMWCPVEEPDPDEEVNRTEGMAPEWEEWSPDTLDEIALAFDTFAVNPDDPAFAHDDPAVEAAAKLTREGLAEAARNAIELGDECDDD